ncbi:hypothetical protein [Rhodopirellula sp. SWK7]|uniref:hypothetical protein n=1 Tax=Rhodopirellula sp. SWK7 TaxID=595460 RepID=UPI0002BE9752|nr:hypothetical protein [Rhodopirellula sp. SWK7]EMI42750.1 hypothetical protein RRSWK_04939 [Rhodopirellula sp. SWK7]
MNSSAHVDGPLFVDTHGQMPPMWSRRAVFFANLLSLFFGNEEQTRVLSEEVGELDSYSARLIPILDILFEGPDNVLVVERKPDPALCRYLSEDLGLTLPRISVLPHGDYVRLGRLLTEDPQASLSEVLKPHDPLSSVGSSSVETWADGYVTDAVLPQLAERLGCRTISTTCASQAGNNKGLLQRFLVEQGLPTVPTEFASRPEEIASCAERLHAQGFDSAVVRSQIGASGVGMMKLTNLGNAETLADVPSYFFHEGPCLVQGWLAPGILGVEQIRSPSTQLFLDETHVYAFDMTEQILSEHNIHEGNESPPPYIETMPGLRDETIRQASQVGRWLHETGYRGTASIDWLVVERAGQAEPDVYVCEINARVTGATYPSLLAKHFHPSGAWLLRNLRLTHPVTSSVLLMTLEEKGHLFHLGRRSGVLPLNFNFGRDGLVHKGQFICIGEDSQECRRYLSLAEEDLPGGWTADRD